MQEGGIYHLWRMYTHIYMQPPTMIQPYHKIRPHHRAHRAPLKLLIDLRIPQKNQHLCKPTGEVNELL